MASAREEIRPLNPAAMELEAPAGGLSEFPPVERWDDWIEYDPARWPRKVEKHYTLVPTICFNCEAGCGLLGIRRQARTSRSASSRAIPLHPGSRGRNCAKGPATINQVTDPERILYPMRACGAARRRQMGARDVGRSRSMTSPGESARRSCEGRRNEILYHVGRPGHELIYNQRILHAWGIDGHNSHTNVCSAGARTGYAFWHGADRPSPDHANARFILLLSSHLEAGHYFNPHAQRIIEAKERGAKVCVIDTRLSNTATKADYWLSTWPGSEAAVLLAMCHVILRRSSSIANSCAAGSTGRSFCAKSIRSSAQTFDTFLEVLEADLRANTRQSSPRTESGALGRRSIVEVAREIGRAGSALATHVWRNAAAGNLGGWQVARALELLVVLMGAVDAPGGTAPNSVQQIRARAADDAAAGQSMERDDVAARVPLAFFEMSFLLPHFLKEGRGKLSDVFHPRL